MPNNEIVQLPGGWSLPLERQPLEQQLPMQQSEADADAHMLYVALEADGSYKIGTCEHCVLQEPGRPGRAWNADGDADLDFDRDRYFALLTHFGVSLTERQAYVCP